MRKELLIILVYLLFSFTSSAGTGDDFDQCKRECSQSCITKAKKLGSTLKDYLNACNVPSRGQGGNGVQAYHSDSCSGNLLASFTYATDCSQLNSSGSSVWGISINGTCYDISDRNLVEACQNYGGDEVLAFHSDSCSGDLIASFGGGTNCSEINNSGSSVWAVSINGTCYNISDKSRVEACQNYGGKQALAFHSDSCSGNLIASFGGSSDCSQLSDSSSSVWAVMINGSCQNISDMSMQKACRRFGGRN